MRGLGISFLRMRSHPSARLGALLRSLISLLRAPFTARGIAANRHHFRRQVCGCAHAVIRAPTAACFTISVASYYSSSAVLVPPRRLSSSLSHRFCVHCQFHGSFQHIFHSLVSTLLSISRPAPRSSTPHFEKTTGLTGAYCEIPFYLTDGYARYAQALGLVSTERDRRLRTRLERPPRALSTGQAMPRLYEGAGWKEGGEEETAQHPPELVPRPVAAYVESIDVHLDALAFEIVL
ncbi:hypothetical protein C8R45DRAFT_1104206 [Mycena sanguinolenta]|nr:hypothetical protein C8R45DRAFT_1104206 [Mycena sanguinolenta]